MSDATSRDQTSAGEPTEADQLREEIAETREELGETVEALAAKADVKAQAQAKVEETSEQIKQNPFPVAALAGGIAAGILLLVLIKRRS